MAESRESSDVDKSKTDFLNRVKTTKSEIRTKFLNLRKDLEDQELRALVKVEKIEREILEKFERASASLKEISQVREQVSAGLKGNATSKLLKKNLKIYDDEIKEIQKNSKIDSTIKLVWKLEKLASICEVSSIVNPYSLHPQPVPTSDFSIYSDPTQTSDFSIYSDPTPTSDFSIYSDPTPRKPVPRSDPYP